MSKQEKTYIGDGVYVSFDGWMLCLTTMREDGREAVIYLEPNVFCELKRFGNKAFKLVPDEEQP